MTAQATAPQPFAVERRTIRRHGKTQAQKEADKRRKRGKLISSKVEGFIGTPELHAHYKIHIEPRALSSTGQATVLGARNIDASPPIERYFNRRELDADEYRNDRLYRAAQRISQAFADSNLQRPGVSNLMPSDHSGIPDKWMTIKLDAFRAYGRAMKAISEDDLKSIVSFVVVYETGHAKDWARLRRFSERGAIVLLRRGLSDLAIYYGLLKKTDNRISVPA